MNCHSNTDETIADLLARDDITGLEMIFDNYYRGLCVCAFNYVDSLSRAEDIVRDEFVAFWEKKRGTRDVTSVRAYLYGTVRNASLNYLRRNNRYVFTDIEDELNAVSEPWEDPAPDEIDRGRVQLQTELDKLPPRTREVFTAIVLDNMRYRDVAQRMGISLNTVKTLYARGLKILRRHLGVVVLLLLQ
jgi:RNA polymerase sigma-70 factor (ECF subfamily)